jgi:hypothetical protein
MTQVALSLGRNESTSAVHKPTLHVDAGAEARVMVADSPSFWIAHEAGPGRPPTRRA